MTPALAYHRLADMFPLMEGAEFDSLVNDISEHGLAEPITLLHNLILDGRNRYLALCQLRATCSPETDPHFFDSYKGDDPLQFVISKNLQRRHLNDPQRAWVAVQIANMRQGERTDLPSANVRKVSQADAAKQASISIRAVQMAKRVHETGVHELVGALKGGKIATSTAADLAELPIDEQRRILAAATAPDVPDMSRFVRTAVQQFRRAEREQELAARQMAEPEGKFGVILEDFEWDFQTRSEAGKNSRHPSNYYPTAKNAHTAEEIVTRTADRFKKAEDDSVVFMWATAPLLPVAFRVLALRGFDYGCHFIWLKDRMSTGPWQRNIHEILLVGVRGNVPAPAQGTQYRSVIERPVREHSRKPNWQYELIEHYFPTLRKLELNPGDDAEPRPGWTRWGRPHRSAGPNDG